MPAAINIPIGTKFGKLTVIEIVKDPRTRYLCECYCGGKVTARSSELNRGARWHCGCLTGQNSITHGMHKTSEYRSYRSMMARCYDPNATGYETWGGAGVTVWGEWRGKGGFERWFAYIGPKPTPQHSIDRYPNKDGNYEPGNVRWATKQEQAMNRRNNIFFTLGERTAHISEWVVETGIKRETLMKRRRTGLSDEEALTMPINLSKRTRGSQL